MPLLFSIARVYLLWGGVALLLSWLLGYLPVAITGNVSFIFLLIGGYIIFGLTLCHEIMQEVCLRFQKKTSIAVLVATLLFFLLLLFLGSKGHGKNLVLTVAGSANLMVFATITGAMLSTAIKRVAELIPISLTAAVADIVSVFFGPTRDIAASLGSYYERGMTGVPPLADSIIIKVIAPGVSVPLPLFGVTDWIILVLFSSSLIRLQKSDNLLAGKTVFGKKLFLPITGCGLLLSILLAQLFGLFLPALPAIALVFICFILLRYPRDLQLHRSDMVLSLLFPTFMAATILFAYR